MVQRVVNEGVRRDLVTRQWSVFGDAIPNLGGDGDHQCRSGNGRFEIEDGGQQYWSSARSKKRESDLVNDVEELCNGDPPELRCGEAEEGRRRSGSRFKKKSQLLL